MNEHYLNLNKYWYRWEALTQLRHSAYPVPGVYTTTYNTAEYT